MSEVKFKLPIDGLSQYSSADSFCFDLSNLIALKTTRPSTLSPLTPFSLSSYIATSSPTDHNSCQCFYCTFNSSSALVFLPSGYTQGLAPSRHYALLSPLRLSSCPPSSLLDASIWITISSRLRIGTCSSVRASACSSSSPSLALCLGCFTVLKLSLIWSTHPCRLRTGTCCSICKTTREIFCR